MPPLGIEPASLSGLVEGSRLSVEARKGPIYGLFHPATMTGAGVADSAAAADSLGVVEELPTGE